MTNLKPLLYKFFILCPPGLEDILVEEIEYKTTYLKQFEIIASEIKNLQIKKNRGSIEFQSSLLLPIIFNHHLKCATRIIWNFAEIYARDLPTLHKKITNLPWKKISKNRNFKFYISSKKSRLIHTDKIEKSLLKTFPNKEKERKQNLFIKFEDDLALISIDLSGEQLYKRSKIMKLDNTYAPLKEHLAAAIVFKSLKDQQNYTLLDPLCGSGTILREAINFNIPIKKDFHYQYIPEIQKDLYKIKNIIKFHGPLFTNQAIGLDKHPIEKQEEFDFIQNDLFKDHLNLNSDKDIIIVSNLPYGQRVKLDKSIDSYILEMKKKFGPKEINFLAKDGLKYKKSLSLKNGGIKVNLYKE